MEEEENLPNLFNENSITKVGTREGSYRQISLMNLDVKILNQILANWIQWYENQAINNHINKKWKIIWSSQYIGKKWTKSNIHFWKILKKKLEIEGNFLNLTKSIYNNITVCVKKWNCFPQAEFPLPDWIWPPRLCRIISFISHQLIVNINHIYKISSQQHLISLWLNSQGLSPGHFET